VFKQNHQTLQRANPVQIDIHAAASLRYMIGRMGHVRQI
jgi:hypothetical protein